MNLKKYITKKMIFILIIIISILTIYLPSNAKTMKVHKWEMQISNACSKYVSTEYTPWHLYNCLIESTRDGYYWQIGWDEPVIADVIMPLSMYQTELLKASYSEKQNIAAGYQQTLPKMYLKKLNARKNVHTNFTQADVDRIWGR